MPVSDEEARQRNIDMPASAPNRHSCLFSLRHDRLKARWADRLQAYVPSHKALNDEGTANDVMTKCDGRTTMNWMVHEFGDRINARERISTYGRRLDA
jgi:hypothetical protein